MLVRLSVSSEMQIFLHMAQPMLLPYLNAVVSCVIDIQNDLTFLVPALSVVVLGSSGVARMIFVSVTSLAVLEKSPFKRV